MHATHQFTLQQHKSSTYILSDSNRLEPVQNSEKPVKDQGTRYIDLFLVMYGPGATITMQEY